MIVDELIALLGYQINGEDDLKRFNKSLDSLEKKAYKLGQTIGKTAAIAGAAVATGFALLGNSVIQTAAKFESYAATLETIEGSADKAMKALDWIKQFAQSTPYEVDELTAAFVKLRSYGLDPMDGTMTVLGDTASGMGKSIDQVVEALADATTFQFERLKELGIVSSQAGDKVTFSWTENGKAMSKSVKKSSEEVTKFLNDVWGRKFGGAMIRQSKTWNGMMSNLGDSWTAFQLRIANAGFFETVKNKLADMMNVVEQWANDGTLDKIATALSAAFVWVADVIGNVVRRISENIKFLNENWETMEPWLKTIAIGFGLLILAAFPLTSIMVGLALAVDDFLSYLQGGESAIGDFIKWIEELIPGASEAEKEIAKLAAAVSAGLAAAFLIAPKAMTGIVIKLVASFVSAAFPLIVGGLTTLSVAVGQGFVAAFALLSNPAGWATILGLVAAALVAYFWEDLQAIWKAHDFSQLGVDIAYGIIEGVQSMAGAVADAILGLIPTWNMETFGFGQGSPKAGPGLPGNTVPNAPTTNPNGVPTTGNQSYLDNAEGNLNKLASAQGGVPVAVDKSTKTQSTTVTAPVTVHVAQASQAPAAVGGAIAGAINQAAQPSRAQSGNTF